MEIWKKGKENVLVISEGELEDLIGLGADRIAEKKGWELPKKQCK